MAKTTFKTLTRTVKNPYRFQFALDFGRDEAGPWFVVVLNEKAFAAGYVPKRNYFVGSRPRKPAAVVAIDGGSHA
jgi:hypothetical protein